jgi:transposase
VDRHPPDTLFPCRSGFAKRFAFGVLRLTDAEWALLEPFFPSPSRVGRPRKWPLRHVFADDGYAGDKLRQTLRKIGKWTVEIIKRSDHAKLYALHAPEVECIAKGKAWTRSELGVKTSIEAAQRMDERAVAPCSYKGSLT